MFIIKLNIFNMNYICILLAHYQLLNIANLDLNTHSATNLFFSIVLRKY